MATTVEGQDRVLATAQHIVKSLRTSKDATDDMLLILSSFDNRLSSISDLVSAPPTTTTPDNDSNPTPPSEIARLDSAEKFILSQNNHSFYHSSPDDCCEFLAAVDEVLNLLNNLTMQEAEADPTLMDRAESVVQSAMSKLEDELRALLIKSALPLDADRLYGSIHRVTLSFASHDGDIIDEEFGNFNHPFHERGGSLAGDVSVDLIHPDMISDLREISDRMIRARYEKECYQVYSSVRRDALEEHLRVLGVERLSIEEVQRIEWNALDEKMKKWVQAVKIFVRVLLTGEKHLCELIFDGSESDLIKEVCFVETAKGCVLQLLNFGEAVAIGKRSPEKLFRILDMYEALEDTLRYLRALFCDESGEFVCAEARVVLDGLEAANQMSALIPETSRKILTPESIRSAAKQSWRCHVVPLRLRRAIGKYLEEQEMGHMKKKVLKLTESFAEIKDVNRLLPLSVSKELVEDPLKLTERSKRWKVKSEYGDIGLTYTDNETAAYVACRMPAVYSACFRIMREIRRRVPDFAPVKVLDFGSGTGSAFWALRELWPRSLERVNLIEPSQSMQRAGVNLVQDMKNVPLIHSYSNLQSLTQDIKKAERTHDLVIASYVLGEIPSLKDRIAIVRQLWGLTHDILVLVEPGTPEGSNIISQMRSHVLWMEKRKCRKLEKKQKSEDALVIPGASKDGAFVIAPCPHDGPCPLAKTGKYCHFVQRLERTESQRAFKRSSGAPLRGFEDEKFSYVVLRRGKRPQEPWPLDGVKFETFKEMHAKRSPEDLEIDYEDQDELETDEMVFSEVHSSSNDSGTEKSDTFNEHENKEEGEQSGCADLGSGWGRIIFMPQKRGRRVEMDVCRATKRDGSEGSFDHLVVTRAKNPTLHLQARKSMWGDLWPL